MVVNGNGRRNTTKIIQKKRTDLIPYEKNPRKNEKAIDKVAASIREFGFKVPIIIDKDGVVAAGHTRLLAAEQLGLEEVPCIIADDLTDEQIKAFRLADNKTAEFSEWDFELLTEELQDITDIDYSEFGFDLSKIENEWFEKRERNDTSHQEGNEEYNEFIDKFELPKTTDDCYTPDAVYEAVADWVAKEYRVSRKNFVRPFYPGGDYQAEKYKKTDIVVDNPPFSILSEIVKFYAEKGVKYFIFAPAVTLFSSSSSSSSCALGVGADITYENKANVSTSFLTNLETEYRFRTAPTLYSAIKEAVDKVRKELAREHPKLSYPDEVITSTKLSYFSKYGVNFRVRREESEHIRTLDAQKESKQAIFGSGYLISKKAAAEKAAAEKAAAEKAAATKFELSDREKEIVKKLGT